MTFQELQERIGTQVEADWQQHDNGGGWVHKSATVDATAFVGEQVIIWGNAQVSGNARVYGNAQVCGDARVYGDTWVSGNAQVSGNAWVKSPLFIIGSRHSLTNAKHGHIQIGCHLKTFAAWEACYQELGQREGYSPEEIAEYGHYIQLFKTVGK